MESFISLTAIAAPLYWANVNTDDIYPGPTASPVSRHPSGGPVRNHTKMGSSAFAAFRWDDDLNPKPGFILNQPPYDRAGILIARENFGCGSSREMAVWCLRAIGVRAIIAPSFGDIFYNNCFKSAVLPVKLPRDAVEALLRLATDSAEPLFTVDLEGQTVTAPDGSVQGFEIGAYNRHMLLNGLDEIEATLEKLPAIEAHEAAYFATRPWLVA
jgi:3-isopropylmalate/(R)-2-methylmalate dehydratase small subunit